MNTQEISERIKYIRKQAGLTQTEFAQKLNCTRDMIKVWEQGKSLKQHNLMLIAKVFGYNEKWLINGEEEPKSDSISSVLDTLKVEYNLNELDLKFVKQYMELTPENRKAVKEFFIGVFGNEKKDG